MRQHRGFPRGAAERSSEGTAEERGGGGEPGDPPAEREPETGRKEQAARERATERGEQAQPVRSHFLPQVPFQVQLPLEDLGAILRLIGLLLQALDLPLHRFQRARRGHGRGAGGGQGAEVLHVAARGPAPFNGPMTSRGGRWAGDVSAEEPGRARLRARPPPPSRPPRTPFTGSPQPKPKLQQLRAAPPDASELLQDHLGAPFASWGLEILPPSTPGLVRCCEVTLKPLDPSRCPRAAVGHALGAEQPACVHAVGAGRRLTYLQPNTAIPAPD